MRKAFSLLQWMHALPSTARHMLIITTGGTIGSDAYPDPERAPEYSTFGWYQPDADALDNDPVLRFLATEDFITEEDEFLSLEPHDSKDVPVADLDYIAAKIIATRHSEIIVTHGTDTLVDNASYIASQIRTQAAHAQGKKIVFTGAMVPLLNDPHFGGNYPSDGIATLLGIATHFAQLVPDVFIAASTRTGANGAMQTQFFGAENFRYLVKERSDNTAHSRFVLRGLPVADTKKKSA